MQPRLTDRDIRRAVGQRIRNVRAFRGLSQMDVERTLGIRAAVLGSYERGDRAISAGRLLVLADAFAVPVDAFLPDEEADAQIVTPAGLCHELAQLKGQVAALSTLLAELVQRREKAVA